MASRYEEDKIWKLSSCKSIVKNSRITSCGGGIEVIKDNHMDPLLIIKDYGNRKKDMKNEYNCLKSFSSDKISCGFLPKMVNLKDWEIENKGNKIATIYAGEKIDKNTKIDVIEYSNIIFQVIWGLFTAKLYSNADHNDTILNNIMMRTIKSKFHDQGSWLHTYVMKIYDENNKETIIEREILSNYLCTIIDWGSSIPFVKHLPMGEDDNHILSDRDRRYSTKFISIEKEILDTSIDISTFAQDLRKHVQRGSTIPKLADITFRTLLKMFEVDNREFLKDTNRLELYHYCRPVFSGEEKFLKSFPTSDHRVKIDVFRNKDKIICIEDMPKNTLRLQIEGRVIKDVENISSLEEEYILEDRLSSYDICPFFGNGQFIRINEGGNCEIYGMGDKIYVTNIRDIKEGEELILRYGKRL